MNVKQALAYFASKCKTLFPLKTEVVTGVTVNGEAKTKNAEGVVNLGTLVKNVTAGGSSIISQDGVATIVNASTLNAGIVQLSAETGSTATNKAATPSAVKSAYDLATAAYKGHVHTFTGTVTGVTVLSGSAPAANNPIIYLNLDTNKFIAYNYTSRSYYETWEGAEPIYQDNSGNFNIPAGHIYADMNSGSLYTYQSGQSKLVRFDVTDVTAAEIDDMFDDE